MNPLEKYPSWIITKRDLLQKYQHYRKIRALMLNLENELYPPEIEQLIVSRLLPLIQEDRGWSVIQGCWKSIFDNFLLLKYKEEKP